MMGLDGVEITGNTDMNETNIPVTEGDGYSSTPVNLHYTNQTARTGDLQEQEQIIWTQEGKAALIVFVFIVLIIACIIGIWKRKWIKKKMMHLSAQRLRQVMQFRRNNPESETDIAEENGMNQGRIQESQNPSMGKLLQEEHDLQVVQGGNQESQNLSVGDLLLTKRNCL